MALFYVGLESTHVHSQHICTCGDGHSHGARSDACVGQDRNPNRIGYARLGLGRRTSRTLFRVLYPQNMASVDCRNVPAIILPSPCTGARMPRKCSAGRTRNNKCCGINKHSLLIVEKRRGPDYEIRNSQSSRSNCPIEERVDR
jgi:hypothetical protein